jgi:hypothetical protein
MYSISNIIIIIIVLENMYSISILIVYFNKFIFKSILIFCIELILSIKNDFKVKHKITFYIHSQVLMYEITLKIYIYI